MNYDLTVENWTCGNDEIGHGWEKDLWYVETVLFGR